MAASGECRQSRFQCRANQVAAGRQTRSAVALSKNLGKAFPEVPWLGERM
ncbi:hypothetical protein K1Y77_08820 [Halomonas qaidamensis]|uniref:Uncharacterized protein n=1 Tax=Halomonas qaidamensis TaxID=2866211 RepID=A0ABY6JMC3_9GAMM|nr:MULTISPECIES: hypothetical protein [Halomonas]UYV17612.1 hypothetical protein K1Y77_08820 [Halomonas qaidamensis]